MHIPFWRDAFHPMSSIPLCWYAMMQHSMTFSTRLSHAFKYTSSMSPLGRVQHFISCLSTYRIDSSLLTLFLSPLSYSPLPLHYLSTTSSLPLHPFHFQNSAKRSRRASSLDGKYARSPHVTYVAQSVSVLLLFSLMHWVPIFHTVCLSPFKIGNMQSDFLSQSFLLLLFLFLFV